MPWVQTVLIGLVFAATGVAADKKPPTEEQLEEWFNNLTPPNPFWASDRSEVVLQSVFSLIDHPKEAVPFLRKRLKPADGPEVKAIDGWVKDYLGDDPKARDTVEAELRKHREDYLVVQKLLKAGQATESQPLRRRVVAVVQNEKVVEAKEGETEPLPVEFLSTVQIELRRKLNVGKRSGPPQARYFAGDASDYDQFRKDLTQNRRALVVLERIGTPEAVDVLKEVAGGREGLPAATAAKEALERLKAK